MCYICGKDRKEIEVKGNFKQHVEQIHSVWNYIYYFAYLNQKQKSDYTGFEQYVKEKYDKQDISFFPLFTNEEELQEEKKKEEQQQNQILQ